LTRMRSIGRGKSDWMIAVICKRVERDTASGGSELGDSVRRRPSKEYSAHTRRRYNRSCKTLSLEKFGDRFGAGADLKFFVDAPNVGVNGLVADAEFVGDFLVDQTLGQKVEDLLFALG
jgi:hypothetical protein